MHTKEESKEGKVLEAILKWGDVAEVHASKKRAYRVAHTAAMAASAAKNADQRKADADVAVITLRAELDSAEIAERKAYHYMIFLRGGPLPGEDLP